jgi:serine/threonine-protein kinase HipA
MKSTKVEELSVLLGGVAIGHVVREGGRLSFTYDSSYRENLDATPLSLSLPLALSEHPHARIEPFLWGLLPDNERVLERWGRRFGVSARNAFALLAHVGEDCAGAVQFVRRERLGAVVGSGAGSVRWLSERDLAERLRTLRVDHAAGRLDGDAGQFSLAGAQPKTALFFDGVRWGVPAGRTPTTHILKPPVPYLDGHLENEHLCLSLARALGLPGARTQVVRFETERAIAIERYDRLSTAGADSKTAILRLHQEDLCQALGLAPALKYQSDGGPTPAAIAALLRAHSRRPEDDVETFVSALAFSFLTAGTDAHAKNYSLLLGARGQVRLAPLYDLASALPYPDLDPRRLKLAMKIGPSYRVREIGRRHFEALAAELELEPRVVVERTRAQARALREALPEAEERAGREGLSHALVARLFALLAKHLATCEKALA